jgi:hypothetical protein
MYAARQTLFVRNPLQKSRELSLFVVGEGGQQNSLVFARDFANFLQGRAALLGEVQRVTATILRIISPLGELSRFQLVNERDQTTGDHPEVGGERLLRDPGSRVENS